MSNPMMADKLDITEDADSNELVIRVDTSGVGNALANELSEYCRSIVEDVSHQPTQKWHDETR